MSTQAERVQWARDRFADDARQVSSQASTLASEADELRDKALRLAEDEADDVELASAAVQVADVLDTLERALSDLRAIRIG